jgi:DNA-binding NtrC family response regulator
VVDDVSENVDVLARLLESAGYRVYAASDGESAIRLSRRVSPDIIVLDVMMPGIDGIETCRRLREQESMAETPILFITARDGAEVISRAFAAGAVDFISKPFLDVEVLRRLETHLRAARLKSELVARNKELERRAAELEEMNRSLQAEVRRRTEAEAALDVADQKLTFVMDREAERWGVDGIIGQSKGLASILENVTRLRSFGSVNVLITGESGTGKELVARALHYGGPRASGPFIAINCVNIPAELAESMLFGHVKGSFTGATSERKGYFELAHGGTLFLDEIGDMPSGLQAKLLRVLQDGRVLPLGATRERQVDVRVVAATNADLASQIHGGRFRKDLYFRLAQYTVHLPPLRERTEDVRLLAGHFLSLFAREMGIEVPALSESAVAALEEYDYPGNVRELKNIIERALIESGGERIEVSHLRLSRLSLGVGSGETHRQGDLSGSETQSKPAVNASDEVPLNLVAAEEVLIRRALAETGGNVAEAARRLGVNRSRIYRKLGGLKND